MKGKIPIIAVVGATASGKTSLGAEIARRFSGEVVSCDSMQIYRTLDIGTAKPTEEEKRGVLHHMIDIADIDEEYSVKKFSSLAHDVICDIHSRGKLPVLVGGTGLYVDSIVLNTNFSAPQRDEAYTKELIRYAQENGNDKLYEMLAEKDPTQAAKLHKNDLRRVVRALETLHTTGKSRGELDLISINPSPYDCMYFAIDMPREILYDRIDRRVDIMIKNGLIEEAARLYPRRKSLKTAACAIGYREIMYYFDGLTTIGESVNLIKRNTRRYAKRQLTWFRRNREIVWLEKENAADDAEKLIKERFYSETTN